jgi:hypothetical protein
MLDHTSSTTATAARKAEPVAINARDLRRALRGATATERAHIAAGLVGCSITGLLPSETARICNVSPAYVTVARGRRGARGPQRRTINRLAKYGPNALWQALDKVTAPVINGNGGDDDDDELARRQMQLPL